MSWAKRGTIYVPNGEHTWSKSHAQLPTADQPITDVLRIYYGTRDAQNRTVITYLEVLPENPSHIRYIHNHPILGLGELGCFDDDGAMPSWIVSHGGNKYLYYTGWNTGRSVAYRNSIGLAVQGKGESQFTRLFRGPILDRTKSEPHFCGTPCVLVENGISRMWYLSCVRWEVLEGRPEPLYDIKYAESTDGIEWDRKGIICIPLKPHEGGIARPSVTYEEGIYKMWYCYRNKKDYRTNRANSYRIGYAESGDGVSWTRKDDWMGLDVSESSWDSDMVAYPYVYEYRGRRHMLYNGNGFGTTGFGYAVTV